MTDTLLHQPALREALDRSADPLAGRARVARVLEAHPWLAAEFEQDAELRDATIAVAAASSSLFGAIERDPVAASELRGASLHESVDYEAEAVAVLGSDDPARALRRWKRQRTVRIAGRDLLGIADLRAVSAELSDLAQACLATAVAIAEPRAPFAVIGMGKLGGHELNYSSDVDVMFVHEEDGADAERTARELLTIMSRPTADGIVFRTDAALRPEGRSGALSRTVDAFEAYWERWAQTWELQALIKATPVAGDSRLGHEFMARAERFVWPDVLDPSAVRESAR